ncbi:hypothetical protein PVAND_006506 [Polypedilum vanderplanki]|uniref:Uncharacterized protein n=1 Tax=Polypedilum vanderplanki TaxID=319348 RepID=A0A9J6C3V2_POLVA|nr:hypothetical protein PVAND_006506 [Polypedilum vanderplanki]
MIDALKAKLLESSQNNQILTTEIMRLSSAQLSDDQINKKNNCCNNDKRATECIITRNTNDSLNNKKNITPFGKVSEEPPTSSSPEISSGNSSLSNGHSSLSDVINEWKQELEEKKCELRHKNATINDLQERLQEKEEKICEAQNDFKSIQIERDKYCQMVAQLKQAIQFHNDSIQYLKRQNAELKEEMDMTKGKLTNHQDSYDEIKKRNIALEGENNNLHITITSMRTTIEELKRGNSMQHSNDMDTINMLSDQLLKETIQKDEQLNRLREANLELRSHIFELNQDILDLMEIVDIQKNRRTLEDYKIAQKEQQQQIEKEISSRERDIHCLRNFRSRCADIESEYLEKMASQKVKSDATIKQLETEITALTEQLIQSHQQTTHYDELMKQTAILQNSMHDLESQNDVLKRTIELYEGRFGELQVDFEKIQFENGNLLMEIENLKSDVQDKNKRISEMTIEHQRLESEFEMQKKSCTCSQKNSPTRTSSTVMQINDLKTKLMNKSLESSKATEALKRKTQQYEKLQKTAFEEKSKLREECLRSIQTIGELKSKIQLLEMRVKEQNDEVVSSREKTSQSLAKLTAIESELASKSAKLEDLEKREEKWRVHAYEITHEIKNRKEESFKREQKLMDEISAKNNSLKDQTRIILQHENSLHHMRSENDMLKQSNATLMQQMNDARAEINELKVKERGLIELLEKTEDELKMIKAEVFQLFNTSALSEIKDVHGKMLNSTEDLQTRYQQLSDNFNKLLDENRTLYEIKNDTISAIEIFKKLQDECNEREKAYQIQISKLQTDKRNLHKDRTRLTKQLLGKHRDMIILNSELDKFRHSEDYESRSTSQYNSLQPFQPTMWPSAVAPLARSTSNPDFTSDRISMDARNLTEKLSHVKNYWQHGIQTAISNITGMNNSSTLPTQPIISQPPKEEDEENISDAKEE